MRPKSRRRERQRTTGRHADRGRASAGKAALAGVLLVAITIAGSAPSTRAAQPGAGVDIPTAAVEVDGHVLFELRGVTGLPAPVRAARVRESIETVAADPTVRSDDLRVVPAGEYTKIVVGERNVMTLADADAELMRVSRTVMADVLRNRIAQAIGEYRRERRPEELLRDALLASAATAAPRASSG